MTVEGKNEGVGEMNKGENGFPHSLFLILVNGNHHLQCGYWLKTLKRSKNSSFKVKN